jgi:hypothetical protein
MLEPTLFSEPGTSLGSIKHSVMDWRNGARDTGQTRDDDRDKKGAAEMIRRAPFLKLAGPGAESALGQAQMLSGRSQRGDSAWYKTLDHLLSLLVETLIYPGESRLLRVRLVVETGLGAC